MSYQCPLHHKQTHTRTHTYKHTHTNTHTNTHTHTQTHTYKHTHTHIHIHTTKRSKRNFNAMIMKETMDRKNLKSKRIKLDKMELNKTK